MMTVAVSLLTYSTVLAVLGPRLIHALPAARTAPRLGAVVWQMAAGSVILSWMVAGLAIVTPLRPLDGLGHLLEFCLTVLHDTAAHPQSQAPQLAGLVLCGAVVGRFGACLAGSAITRRRRRLRHARMLKIVAYSDPELGALVLEHPTAMAYCVPGRLRQTVVTRGALDILNPRELAAVLAHERAHLDARHDLALTPIQALDRAFPHVPLFAAAARELPVLLEMCADDAAARRHGSAAVIGALRSLSARRTPEGTLAAGGSSADTRIERLLKPAHRRLTPRVAFSSAVTLLAVGPLLAAAAPVIISATSHLGYCPVPPLS